MQRKRQKILIIIVLVLLVGIIIGFWLGKIGYKQPGNSSEINKIIDPDKSFVGEFKVVRVIDGDTLEIAGGERVRYIGIDAPETVDPQKPVECFGPEATAKNKALVAGKTVRLEKDLTDRDKYNRLLRYVYVGETFINQELVRQGFALATAYSPDTKYQAELSAAQKEAQTSARGLWSVCLQKK